MKSVNSLVKMCDNKSTCFYEDEREKEKEKKSFSVADDDILSKKFVAGLFSKLSISADLLFTLEYGFYLISQEASTVYCVFSQPTSSFQISDICFLCSVFLTININLSIRKSIRKLIHKYYST